MWEYKVEVATRVLPTELIMCVFGVRFLCVHSCIKAIYKRATSCKWDAIKANPKPFVGSFYSRQTNAPKMVLTYMSCVCKAKRSNALFLYSTSIQGWAESLTI